MVNTNSPDPEQLGGKMLHVVSGLADVDASTQQIISERIRNHSAQQLLELASSLSSAKDKGTESPPFDQQVENQNRYISAAVGAANQQGLTVEQQRTLVDELYNRFAAGELIVNDKSDE